MLKELKFVMGAVAKKDFLPAMTHFAIEGGTVRSYNGCVALSAPIAFDIDCKPKADKLVQAISKCPDNSTPVLSLTTAGRLSIKAGAFKAFIECVTEETPHVLPDGDVIRLDAEVEEQLDEAGNPVAPPLTLGDVLLNALRVLAPFIGDDASRPWSNGVLFKGQSAFATNNVLLVEYWTGAQMPVEVNVPRVAIREMLRINEAPTHAQVTPTSMTFHYKDKRWVRTQLLELAWPDMSPLLDKISAPRVLDDALFVGLEKLEPFADKMGRVFINEGVLSTIPFASGQPIDEGAFFELPNFPFNGIYQIQMLMLLRGVAQQADLSMYPSPCIFYGDRLRGAIVGMRP
jgi:hypothetical protein